MPQTLTLKPVLDLNAASLLKADLTERRGQSIEVDASNVQRLGGLCLQVLLAARRVWEEEGLTMTVKLQSDAFVQALRLFGCSGRFDEPGLEGGIS